MNLDPISQYIVQAAARRGIDPTTALRVAKSEGLGDYVGDGGSSFGPYQLHYGGVASGGNKVGGLGDDFTKATGLNARDPNTIRQQIDFALDHVSKHGWGAFHGAAKVGIGNFDGIGGNNQSSRYGALTGVAGGTDPTAQGGAFAPPAQGGATPSFGGGMGGSASQQFDPNALLSALMQHQQQPRPSLLGQLLFGDKGLHGYMQQHMPNGLFGAIGGGQPPQPSAAQPPQIGPGAMAMAQQPPQQSTPMNPSSPNPLQAASNAAELTPQQADYERGMAAQNMKAPMPQQQAGAPMQLPGASMEQGQQQPFQGGLSSLLSLFGIGGQA